MFSELVVAYLFLGGCGAGACAVCAVLGLLADGNEVRCGLTARFSEGLSAAWRRLFVPPLAVALGALVLGVVCLSADLGRFDRVLLLAVSAPTSYLVVGFWALVLCTVLAAAVLLVWQGTLPVGLSVLRALCALLLVGALVTATYTGLLLAGMPSVPLWRGPWLPCVFVLSSLSCGVALVAALAALTGAGTPFGRTIHGLARVDQALIVLETAALVLWLSLTWMAAGGSAALANPANPTDAAALVSVTALIAGPWAILFWGGLAVVGLGLPFALECAPSRPGVVLVSSACVLTGGAALRFLAVAAALQPVVSSMSVPL